MTRTKTHGLLFLLCTASVFLFMRCNSCAGDAMNVDNLDASMGDGSVQDLTGTSPPQDLTGAFPDGGVIIRTGDGGTKVCYPATCQGKLYQCGNCMDDDGDGLVDSDDPDCVGACDNTEKGFALGIPGANNAPCKADCYFDQDTGSGNDNCYWDHTCDPNEKPGNLNPEQDSKCTYVGAAGEATYGVGGGLTCTTAQAMQSNVCKNFCGPLTPNACDCFGCCTIGPQADVANKKGIWLGSLDSAGNPSCSPSTLGDPTKCHPCEVVTSCYKACGPCQLCVGDPPTKTFPAYCYTTPDGGTSTPDMAGTDAGAPNGGGTNCPPLLCPSGQPPCGVTGCNPCAAGFYCVTGCCQPVIG